MRFLLTRHRKPGNLLEAALIDQADRLTASPEDVGEMLQFFNALSIYKCQIENGYRGDTNRVQINLFKRNKLFGIRIFRIGH